MNTKRKNLLKKAIRKALKQYKVVFEKLAKE